ncbi:olfactory receptor 10AG1-like [Paroedura picta]|uniref:olfactory receptor 10AG1-like n=1 Tax=Paroedura picta TaxID=143630 RepID=UPI004055AB1A
MLDIVDQELLTHWLANVGIWGTSLQWLVSFLQGLPFSSRQIYKGLLQPLPSSVCLAGGHYPYLYKVTRNHLFGINLATTVINNRAFEQHGVKDMALLWPKCPSKLFVEADGKVSDHSSCSTKSFSCSSSSQRRLLSCINRVYFTWQTYRTEEEVYSLLYECAVQLMKNNRGCMTARDNWKLYLFKLEIPAVQMRKYYKAEISSLVQMLTNKENILHNNTALAEFILLGLSDEPNLQSILFSTFLVIYIIILAGNLIIILLTLVDPALHTPMYFFLRNLSFLEICYTSVNIPKMLENLLFETKSISFLGCAVQTYFAFFLGGSECFLLASMAYDRYVAICKPLHYPVFMNRKVCMGLAAVSWLSGFLMSFGHTSMVFTMSFCGSNEIDHFFCDIPPLLKLACGDTSRTEIAVFVVAMVFVTLPFILILMSYAGIIATILGISSAEGRKKTFSTCSSHLIVVTLFYGSACVIYLKPKSIYSPNTDKYLSLFYTIVGPVLNPIIYSLRNKEVKEKLWEFPEAYTYTDAPQDVHQPSKKWGNQQYLHSNN